MCPMWLCTKYKVENHFSGYGGSLISEGLERGPKSVTLALRLETLLGDWTIFS